MSVRREPSLVLRANDTRKARSKTTAATARPNPVGSIARSPPGAAPAELAKCPTGIRGFDEITRGGLPLGRPTLVCGGAGCGKTVFGVEFLVRGALEFDEPGLFVSFEEAEDEIVHNAASLQFDLAALAARRKLDIEQILVDRNEIEEAGEYDLEGLFIRLGLAIDAIGAKRIVLDTIETLFAAFSNEAVLRAELRRLFRWLKNKNVTAVVTAERGQGHLTRQGLEEYVSDCVILLDHRVEGQVSTRRMRVVKYRGSAHETNEFPFLIDQRGISVLPITSIGLEHHASLERVSTGSEDLDAMLGGEGYFRGSTVLVSGTAGTGKSSLAAHLARSAAARGESCIYFAFEESPSQIIRNMGSLGLDLEPLVERGTLQFVAARPTLYGFEMHLLSMHKAVAEARPRVVIVDPITNLAHAGSSADAWSMLVRLIDHLKSEQITALFTTLSDAGASTESTPVAVTSLMDTWIMLRVLESGGECNRVLTVMKSRGMAHSNEIHRMVVGSEGIELRPDGRKHPAKSNQTDDETERANAHRGGS
jgi:circadian clock protein KaiC